MVTLRWKDNAQINAMAVPAFTGLIDAVLKMIGKGMVIGLKLTWRGYGCFCVEWVWYLIFLGMFVLRCVYLQWLNRGLAAFSPVHVFPLSTTLGILVTTFGGFVVFHEGTQFDG